MSSTPTSGRRLFCRRKGRSARIIRKIKRCRSCATTLGHHSRGRARPAHHRQRHGGRAHWGWRVLCAGRSGAARLRASFQPRRESVLRVCGWADAFVRRHAWRGGRRDAPAPRPHHPPPSWRSLQSECTVSTVVTEKMIGLPLSWMQMPSAVSVPPEVSMKSAPPPRWLNMG